MGEVSRRSFLIGSAAAVSGRALSMASDPDMKFPAAIRDRLSVASWPFRAYIEADVEKWAKVIAKAGIRFEP